MCPGTGVNAGYPHAHRAFHSIGHSEERQERAGPCSRARTREDLARHRGMRGRRAAPTPERFGRGGDPSHPWRLAR
jgi:hypothetical protein